MDAKHQDDLEDDLGLNRLPEVEGPVHHHGAELDQHHDQEGSRHLILRQGRRNVCSWVFLQGEDVIHHICFKYSLRKGWTDFLLSFETYTKRPEPEHNDDEVDGVGEEHQHVDVRHGAVLRMDQVEEELPDGKVDSHEPGTSMEKERGIVTTSEETSVNGPGALQEVDEVFYVIHDIQGDTEASTLF